MTAHNLNEEIQVETKSDEPRVFVIPSPNMPRFEESLAKLVKRANRIGCQVPTYTLLKETTKTIQVVVDVIENEYGQPRNIMGDKLILMYHITLNSSEVVVAGHEFVCTIEHTEQGNILHTLKGKSVPLKYRECQPWCDHCKTLRRRNDTFVVRHVENDTYLQVGRNCLADFLGRDAERYANIAELYFELDELAEASESEGGGGWGSGGPSFDYLESYLSYVAEVIKRDGWKSRTTAKEYGGRATADVAMYYMHPPKEDVRDGKLLWRTPSDRAIQSAKDAIAWCESLPDEEVEASEYLHNIRIIARRGVVGSRQTSYAASIVSSYQRHMGDLKRKQKFADQAAISQYVGTVGERSNFRLTVDHVVSLEGDFGYSSMHLMYDAHGNRFTWTSSSCTLEKGKEVLLKGTIKDHRLYKEVKQTVLSRCQELESKNYSCVIAGATYEGSAESDKEFKKDLQKVLGLARWPRGVVVSEVPATVVQKDEV